MGVLDEKKPLGIICVDQITVFLSQIFVNEQC